MQAHHYLGSLQKIGNTIRYVATQDDQWLALLSFSVAALKCSARDQWSGWDYRHQSDRLNLVANNSRFLILPERHKKNLATQILSLSRWRIQQDWVDRFGFSLLMLETYVDPDRFHGTIYRSANWEFVGTTKGYRRIRSGYSEKTQTPKLIFMMPLQRNARRLLARPVLPPQYHSGKTRMKLTADQMLSLYDCFRKIDDHRRAQGRKHPLPAILSLSAAAILCGMRGYKDISLWAKGQAVVSAVESAIVNMKSRV